MIIGQTMSMQVLIQPSTIESSPGGKHSSCQSVQADFFDSIETPQDCSLHLAREGHAYEVAKGTVHPSGNGVLLHFVPIPSGFMKVSVDKVLDGENDTHLLVPSGDYTTIGQAEGTFVLWPKDMIVLDKEVQSNVSTDTNCGTSSRSGPATPTTQELFANVNFIDMSPHWKYLRAKMLDAGPTFQYFSVDMPPTLFHNKEGAIMVTSIDLKDFLIDELVNVMIFQTYMMFIYKYIVDDGIESVGFMDPSIINKIYLKKYKTEAMTYMIHALLEQQEKKLILAPYFERKHWILLMIMPKDNTVLVLDPLPPRQMQDQIMNPLKDAFIEYALRRAFSYGCRLTFKQFKDFAKKLHDIRPQKVTS